MLRKNRFELFSFKSIFEQAKQSSMLILEEQVMKILFKSWKLSFTSVKLVFEVF